MRARSLWALLLTVVFTRTRGVPQAQTKRRLYDAFLYNGERHMLSLRLHHLASLRTVAVVKHILVESNVSFSGKSTPLYFRERDSKDPTIAPFIDDIVHIVVQQEGGSGVDPWHRERDQRNAMLRGLHEVNGKADDLFMVSDVDEIPRLSVLKSLLYADENPCRGTTCHVESQMYYYTLQHKIMTERWLHPDIMSVADCAKGITPSKLREKGFQLARQTIPFDTARILHGGWHLSYFGAPEEILDKIESFSHQEFNTPEIASLEKIREARRSGVDPLRRPGQNISVASVCNLRDIPNVVRVMLNI